MRNFHEFLGFSKNEMFSLPAITSVGIFVMPLLSITTVIHQNDRAKILLHLIAFFFPHLVYFSNGFFPEIINIMIASFATTLQFKPDFSEPS